MYIKASLNKIIIIEFYCDLSHENFITFIESVHKIGYKTEISDNNKFKEIFNKEDKPSLNHTMWA
ncbi:MAG: hypothetical protein ABIP51_07895, partial [Bacteroidia bacterium]